MIAIAIAIAENDDEREPFAKYTLEEEFERYGINSEIEIEIEVDSLQGWCPSDSAVYNEARAEKAWSRLLELFKKSLV